MICYADQLGHKANKVLLVNKVCRVCRENRDLKESKDLRDHKENQVRFFPPIPEYSTIMAKQELILKYPITKTEFLSFGSV